MEIWENALMTLHSTVICAADDQLISIQMVQSCTSSFGMMMLSSEAAADTLKSHFWACHFVHTPDTALLQERQISCMLILFLCTNCSLFGQAGLAKEI